jgi:hypothetical protein
MTTSATVLFGRPQREIASLLLDHINRCSSASLVAGFMTVDGIQALMPPLQASPGKLAHLVVGAGTWSAFDAMDNLRQAGVSAGALYVHLGHTRPSGTKRHPFVRYHPMLHSKVYLFEMDDGTAAAFVGSHNLTSFALRGKNGEAGVLLKGPSTASEFVELRKHIAEAVRQAVPYDPGLKDAYAAWTLQFIDGLYAEANGDIPRDAEGLKTIIVLATSSGSLPRSGEIVYFELPEALDRIESMRAEVHVYIFRSLPPSASAALSQLDQAVARLTCTVEGIESGQGGLELRVDWNIANRLNPVLAPAPKPFRPRTAQGMQQVRVRVKGPLTRPFEYLFDTGKVAWSPVLDPEDGLEVDDHEGGASNGLPIAERPALLSDQRWLRVRALERGRPPETDARALALWESTPEGEAFILFSPRRRKLDRSASGS